MGMAKRLIKKASVLDKIDKGRTWLSEAVRDGTFPSPIMIGRTPHWLESEVDDWIDSLVAEQRGVTQEAAA